MVDRKDSDLIRIDTVENAVREPQDDYPPHSRIDFGGRRRNTAGVVESRFDTQDELIAQSLPFRSYQALASARSSSASGVMISGRFIVSPASGL
jgi:hypothetical protein